MKNYRRKKIILLASGSALSEVPPALFLLFFFAVFPVLNLIFLGFIYTSCALLNNYELREAVRTPSSQLSQVLTSLEQRWQIGGEMTAPPTINVSYDKIGSDTYVTVANTFSMKPFLTVPYFKGIPGLGAPLIYTISSKRLLEDPSYASL